MADSVRLGAPDTERGCQDRAHANRALRPSLSLDENPKHVVRLQIATHVHAVLVDVRERPSQLRT